MSINQFDSGANPKTILSTQDSTPNPFRDKIISLLNRIPNDTLNQINTLIQSESWGQLNLIMENLDSQFNNFGETSLQKFFNFENAGTYQYDRDGKIINAAKFYFGGLSRSTKVQQTLEIYFDKLVSGISNGDIVYMTNTNPCPNYDKSKSPFEIAKKVWENLDKNYGTRTVTITTPTGETGQETEQFFRGLESLPPSTRLRVTEAFANARVAGIKNNGEFDRDTWSNGAQIPVDLGRSNGSYSKNPAVSLAKNEQERINAINESFKPYNMPAEAFQILDKAQGPDGNYLDSEIDVSYKELIAQLILDRGVENTKQFIKDFENFINLPVDEAEEQLKKEGGFFSKGTKKNIQISYLTALALLEAYKLGEVAKLGKGISGGLASHGPHFRAQIQGGIEILGGLYKVAYYFSHGKYSDGISQLSLTGLSAFFEFGLPEIASGLLSTISPTALSFLTRLTASLFPFGGYVGLTISAYQAFNEFVIKPYAARSYANSMPDVINELLDLERQQIEKECCTNIHPELYRNTLGRFSVLMTNDGFIPFEREYRNTVRGEGESLNRENEAIKPSPQPGPCETNGRPPITTSTRYIKVVSSQEREFLGRLPAGYAGPPTEPVYGVSQKNNFDPCQRREIIVRPEDNQNQTTPREREGDTGDIQSYTPYKKDKARGYTPYWSMDQERNLENATVQYNTTYSTDVFKFKIDAAKCKTGEISSPTPTGGGALDRDGFSPLAGESGMPGGFHRVGVSIIARPIFEYVQETMVKRSDRDTSSRVWTGLWEVSTRENGFSVGSGGAGTGTKLRGITSFFYDPLNPPKPIEPV